MEYRSLYALGKEKLAAAGIPEADLDARLLLEYVCHTSRNDLLVHGDREVAETEQQAYEHCFQANILAVLAIRLR